MPGVVQTTRGQRLVHKGLYRLGFRPTLGGLAIYLVLLAVGALILVLFVSRRDYPIEVAVVAIAFIAAGSSLMYLAFRPIVFDKQIGLFWKGRRRWALWGDIPRSKDTVELDKIPAIQIVSGLLRPIGDDDTRPMPYYQLNLVLKDASRICVVSHGDLRQILLDAEVLSRFLNVPLWRRA